MKWRFSNASTIRGTGFAMRRPQYGLPVDIWGEQSQGGLFTVMVHPGTVPTLASMFDPGAPLVYLDYAPFGGNVPRAWDDVRLPLSPDRLDAPDTVMARRVSVEVVMPTELFMSLAVELGPFGCFCAQIQRKPPDEPGYGDNPHPAARKSWFEKVGLLVAFDLPHHRESAQVVTLSEAARSEAINRLVAATS